MEKLITLLTVIKQQEAGIEPISATSVKKAKPARKSKPRETATGPRETVANPSQPPAAQ